MTQPVPSTTKISATTHAPGTPPLPLSKAGCRADGGPSPTEPATVVSACHPGSGPAPGSATTPRLSRMARPGGCSPCAPKPSAPLPQASRDYRSWARRNLPGFREVRYDEDQIYAGRPGAVVFEYEAISDGRRVHVRHVNVKGRSWGYNVELIVPATQWDASQGLARQFEQAFQPLD